MQLRKYQAGSRPRVPCVRSSMAGRMRRLPIDTMTTFVDPRSDPEPPAQVSANTATQGEELRELVHLCLAGHVYDVERWIQNGRPIQALTYKRPKKAAVVSPMRAAIRTKHRDIVLLRRIRMPALF